MFLLYLRRSRVPVSPRHHGDAAVGGVPVPYVLPNLVPRVHDAKLDAELCSHFLLGLTFSERVLRLNVLIFLMLTLSYNSTLLTLLYFRNFNGFAVPKVLTVLNISGVTTLYL